MTDAHHAGDLLHQALLPFFPQSPPDTLHSLGQEVYSRLYKQLRGQGLDRDHCQDVFQDFLLNVIRHLRQHGAESVRELRAWLHTVARHTGYQHLKRLYGPKRNPHLVVSLDSLLEGDAEYYLPHAPPVMTHGGDELEQLLLEAIHRLKGRNREFAERHFLRGQAPDEIMREMGLPSDRSFKRLQRQTLRLLIEILKTAFAYTLASSWVA